MHPLVIEYRPWYIKQKCKKRAAKALYPRFASSPDVSKEQTSCAQFVAIATTNATFPTQ